MYQRLFGGITPSKWQYFDLLQYNRYKYLRISILCWSDSTCAVLEISFVKVVVAKSCEYAESLLSSSSWHFCKLKADFKITYNFHILSIEKQKCQVPSVSRINNTYLSLAFWKVTRAFSASVLRLASCDSYNCLHNTSKFLTSCNNWLWN